MQTDAEVALEFKKKALVKLCGDYMPKSLNLSSHATLHTAIMLASQEIVKLRDRVDALELDLHVANDGTHLKVIK